MAKEKNEFVVLSVLAGMLRVLGWLTAFGALGIIALGVVADLSSESGMMMAGIGVGTLIGGLWVVAMGEAVGVTFAIEQNTRMTRLVVEQCLEEIQKS